MNQYSVIACGWLPPLSRFCLTGIVALHVLASSLCAQAVTWEGSLSSDWGTGGNWSGGSVPGSGDDVVIDGHQGHHPLLSTSATVKSLTIGQATASTLTFSNAWEEALTITNGNLNVYGNGVVIHADNSTAAVHRIHLVCHGDVLIHAGGTLTADSRGYNAKNGIGAGGGTDNHAAGAGHGGRGGNGLNGVGGIAYGSATNPVALGSGGGRVPGGGKGGGAIRLTVAGALTQNGVVSANGGNGNGGGAGGSIWIDAQDISGGGTLSANGGNHGHSGAGGGAGGRIALHYTGDYSFSGMISLNAGAGTDRQRPLMARQGSLYLTDYRDLHPVITGGMALPSGSYTNLTAMNMVISNSAVFFMEAGSSFSLASLTVHSNATVRIQSDPVTGESVSTKAGNVNVVQGGLITADELGYSAGTGVGGGNNNHSAGGGYGGRGGNGYAFSGGIVYGSATNPVLPGSGGGIGTGRGMGGGAIRLEVDDTLTVNGIISANGANGIGGGSGGAIWISTDWMEGTGILRAEGGDFGISTAGGGGGGRVMIAYGFSSANLQKLINNEAIEGLLTYQDSAPFMGTVSVTNGIGYQNGDPGTALYLRVIEEGSFWLEVEGSPQRFGTPSPYFFGATINLAEGTWITNRVNSPAEEAVGLRRACIGWVVTNSMGEVMAQGATTNSVFQMTTNLYQTWYWTNEWFLSVSSSDALRGSVNAGSVNGWYTNGVQVMNISASPEPGYAFNKWTGSGVPTGMENENPLTVTMDQARTLVAEFSSLSGISRAWTGGAGYWHHPSNWSPEGIPDLLDDVTIGSGTVTLTNWVDTGSLVISNGAHLVVSNWFSTLKAESLTIAGRIGLPAAFVAGAVSNRIHIICTNLLVFSGGILDAKSAGYASRSGPGMGTGADNHAGGGGHGGRGGNGNNGIGGSVYGSVEEPGLPGSGGGNAAGGGVIRLEVSESLTVNGTVAADGANGNGAGAGGSIWITAHDVSGHGLIAAPGGNQGTAAAGGGGGGRIAIHTTGDYSFTGVISLSEGISSVRARPLQSVPGTLYLTDYRDLHPVIGGGMAWPVGDYSHLASKDMVINSGATFFLYSGSSYAFRSLTVSSNATVVFHGDPVTGEGSVIQAGDVTVAQGGEITASHYGFSSGPGVGGGNNNHAGGGGYGGVGGYGYAYSGGVSYGSATNPVQPGSGSGAGGMGGGVVTLDIGDLLTVNGVISADGTLSVGGGSGGAIRIRTGRIVGEGVLRANGGNSSGAQAGGGGGGRIALVLTEPVRSELFSGEEPGIYSNYAGSANGRVLVGGGTGYGAGENGSFYLDFMPPPLGTLIQIR